MTLSVLGPVILNGAGGPRPLSGRKAREILTLLVLASPRPISGQVLTELVWDEPPLAAIKTVQGHLSRLRTALAATSPVPGTITGSAAGYRFSGVPDLVDVLRLADLRQQARGFALEDDHDAAADLLDAAVRLWRGDPELPDTLGGDLERTRLRESRLNLTEDHLGALIRAGRSAEALPDLAQLVRQHPGREYLRELQIEALYRSGRRADALAACRRARIYLRNEAGIEPGSGLQSLERAVFTEQVPELPIRRAARRATPVLQFDGPYYAEPAAGFVAYATLTGPAVADGDLLVINPTFVPIDSYLEEPHLIAAFTGLARRRRLIVFDRRGIGLSDPAAPGETLSLADWVQDAIAVLDVLRVQRIDVFANADTTMVALLLAAKHPDRVRRLCLVNPFPRFTSSSDYRHGLPPAETVARLDAIHTPAAAAASAPVDVLSWRIPAVAADAAFRRWWDAVGRRGASPRSAAAIHRVILDADVRPVLPQVLAPTLLVVRRGCASYDPGHASFLAARLADATTVESDDRNDAWFVGDVDWVAEEVDQFLCRRDDRDD